MRGLLAKTHLDGFIVAILATVTLAALLPARGDVAAVLSNVVTWSIALLFFLYGVRLSPRDAMNSLKHWPLHLTILAFTFLTFPIIGMALRVLEPAVLGHSLYTGVLFLTLVPSTVQSSVAFVSIARGNIAGAVVSASASNLLGIFLTPVLVVVMSSIGFMQGTSVPISIDARSILDICAQLLLPFLLGQLFRLVNKHNAWAAAAPTRLVDRGAILLVVYAAFSEGMREGIWQLVTIWQLLMVVALAVLLVTCLLTLTRLAARKIGFDRADTIAIQFCASKKSLATGLPMAAVLFAGGQVGLIVLPLMIYHQVQLMICSWLAARYARDPRELTSKKSESGSGALGHAQSTLSDDSAALPRARS